MGKLILTVVGMGIGFIVGGPLGAQIGGMIGGMVGAMLFPTTVTGPRLNDLTVSASTYGNPIPKLYGTMRMASNMIWSAGIKEHKETSSGKGGPVQTTYKYTCSFAVAFCAGPATGVLRIWGDTKVISHNTPPFPTKPDAVFWRSYLAGNHAQKGGGGKFPYSVYLGTEDQLPDPLMESIDGVGNVPGYRGLCYIVFRDMPLEDFGNRVPSISAEISMSHTSAVAAPTFLNSGGTAVDRTGDGVYVDWLTERTFIVKDTTVNVYSNGMMKQTGSYELAGPPLTSIYDDNTFHHFSVGQGGLIYSQWGVSNSQRVAIYDSETFKMISYFGSNTNSLAFAPFIDCSGKDDSEHQTIGGGSSGTFFNVGGIEYIMFNGQFNNGGVWTITGHFVDWFYGDILFTAVTEYYTEAVSFAVTSGNLEMAAFRITPGYAGAVVSIPNPDPGCSSGFSYAAQPDIYGNRTSKNLTFTLPAPYAGMIRSIDGHGYDQGSDAVLVACSYWLDTGHTDSEQLMASFSMADGHCRWVVAVPSPGFPAGHLGASRITGQSFGWTTYDGTVKIMNMSSGVITTHATGGPSTFNPIAWDDTSQSTIVYSYGDLSAPLLHVFSGLSGQAITVGSICEDLMLSTGLLQSGDIDVTALNDVPVVGYVVSRAATARDCLQQLAGTYFFDGVESDYKIKLVTRGASPIVSVTQDQLANLENRDVQLKETLTQEIELPVRFSANYYDQARDYQQGSQFSKRNIQRDPTTNSRKETKVDLPVVMTSTQAKQVTDKALKMVWANRIGLSTKLPWAYLAYDPTDIITITMNNGSVRNMRIDKIELGADMSIAATGVTENEVAYVSHVTAADPALTFPVSADTGSPPTEIVVMNTPLLKDSHDTQGRGSLTYLTAYAYGPGFKAAYLQDRGASKNWVDAGYVGTEPTIGTCTEALPSTRAWAATDTQTRLTISLFDSSQTLESVTYDQLLAGANMALVGNEVIQFQNATLNGDGTYTLSTILRARRGTNTRVATHVANEIFVLIVDDNTQIDGWVRPVATPVETISFRAVGPSTSPDMAKIKAVSLTPEDLRPYTLEDFTVSDDGTTVTVLCHRRSRLTFGLRDYVSQGPFVEGAQPGNAVGYLHAGMTYADVIAYGTSRWEDIDVNVRRPAGVTPYFTPILTAESSTGTLNSVAFAIPYSATSDHFVLETFEQGYADGMIKAIAATRTGSGTWDVTELY